MRLIKVISTRLDDLSRRLIKFQGNGKDDIQECQNVSSFGDDSNPTKDLVAIRTETGVMGESVVVGYINKNQLAQIGEKRLFSTDEDGNLETYIWLKNDGTIHFGGNAGHLTRFEELKTGFDQLKNDFNSFVNTYNTHVHAGVTPGSGSSAVTPSLGTPTAASIDNSKIDELKTL